MGGYMYKMHGKCRHCEAMTPAAYGRTPEEAVNAFFAAALRRYEPPCRPMTLEELKSHTKAQDAAPVWLDDIEEMSNTGWTYSHIISDWLHGFDERTYGKEWRCWPRKPTEGERREAKWNDG